VTDHLRDERGAANGLRGDRAVDHDIRTHRHRKVGVNLRTGVERRYRCIRPDGDAPQSRCRLVSHARSHGVAELLSRGKRSKEHPDLGEAVALDLGHRHPLQGFGLVGRVPDEPLERSVSKARSGVGPRLVRIVESRSGVKAVRERDGTGCACELAPQARARLGTLKRPAEKRVVQSPIVRKGISRRLPASASVRGCRPIPPTRCRAVGERDDDGGAGPAAFEHLDLPAVYDAAASERPQRGVAAPKRLADRRADVHLTPTSDPVSSHDALLSPRDGSPPFRAAAPVDVAHQRASGLLAQSTMLAPRDAKQTAIR
jgi:hypothetical protein